MTVLGVVKINKPRQINEVSEVHQPVREWTIKADSYLDKVTLNESLSHI
jgi:hypothetical protein